jgi:putative DNA primase/helicase
MSREEHNSTLRSEKNIEKLTTQEKIDILTNWILDQYVSIKHFIKNGVSIGLYKWDGKRFTDCEKELEGVIEYNELGIPINTHIVNEVIEKIKRRTQHFLNEKREDLIITFENGIMDWTDILLGNVHIKPLEEYGKELRENTTSWIPFIYIPHELDIALLKELFEKLFKDKNIDIEIEKQIIEQIEPDIVNVFKQWVGDNWLLLLEIIGYTLYPDYPYHKAFMLLGKGNNGKSTYIKLINNIVGEHNVSAIPLQTLLSDKFARAELYHKLVNTFADLPPKPLEETGIFKALTGEDRIDASIKFVQKMLGFYNYAKLIFSANELPKTRDITDAFFHRWIIIDFPNKFPEQIGFLESVFTEEKIKRIIAIGIWAFYLVTKRNKFSIEISGEETKKRWMRETDPIYDFIQSMIERGILEQDPDGKIKDTELWELWVKYAEEQEYEKMDKRRFTITLQNYGITKVRGKTEEYYKGLRKIEDRQEYIRRDDVNGNRILHM